MTPTITTPQQQRPQQSTAVLEERINQIIDNLMSSLPKVKDLTSDERRGIIARYTAVLEGNFIYWMTATLIAVHAEKAKPILLENLHEEVRDSHPAMMRRFAIAANAFPTDIDALAVDDGLTRVRLFMARLSAVHSLATMAFFEGFIQKFMAYLADLAHAQGSTEMEYTDVHGICDIEHTEGLFRALSAEMDINPLPQNVDALEGVYLFRSLIEEIVFSRPVTAT